MKRWLFLFFSLIALDAASKAAALKLIPPLLPKSFGYPFGGIPLFDWGAVTGSLNLIHNTGAAWGLFQGQPTLLFLIRSAIIGALIVYLLFFNKAKHSEFSLWLVAAGAVGNAIDYLAYGAVIDFLHFTFWGWSFPIFNLADSCITIGAAWLLLFAKKKGASHAS